MFSSTLLYVAVNTQTLLALPRSVNGSVAVPSGESSGLGDFPAVFSIIVCGPGIAVLLSEIFSSLFVLLPKFAIAGLPSLGNKHASCSYLHLFQGKPRPEEPARSDAAFLILALSPLLLGSQFLD